MYLILENAVRQFKEGFFLFTLSPTFYESFYISVTSPTLAIFNCFKKSGISVGVMTSHKIFSVISLITNNVELL